MTKVVHELLAETAAIESALSVPETNSQMFGY